MGLGTLLGGQALKELLRLSPQIITAAEQVYATVRRNRQRGTETETAVDSRLSRLEAADVAQAELLEQMAGQIRALSVALEQLTARIRLVTCLAGGAGALALIAALLLLVSVR